MSILIKGMAMPKNCLFCPLQGGTADCRLTQKTYNWGLTERPSDCPLVPVPPHGRLGDLDAAVEKLKKLREYHLDDSQSGVFIAAGISQCIEVLTGKDAPTIIEAEEGE